MLNTWQNHTLAVNHQLLDIFTQSIISRLTFTHLANAKVFRSFVCSNAKGWKISSNFPKFSKNFHHFAKVSKKKSRKVKKKKKSTLCKLVCLDIKPMTFICFTSWATKTKLQVKAWLVLRVKVYILHAYFCSEVQVQWLSAGFKGTDVNNKRHMYGFGIIKIFLMFFFSLFCSPRQHFVFITNTVKTGKIVKYH